MLISNSQRLVPVAAVLLALVGAAVGVGAAPARAAGWSRAATLPSSAGARWVVARVDAHGDAAVAWSEPGTVTSVRIAVRRGVGGSWSQSTLRSARGLSVGRIVLVMAPNGELTVAWIDQIGYGHRVVRAAHRTISGRWSPVQAVGNATPFAYAYPTMASTAGGTVVLAYDAAIAHEPGMAVAWRAPGRDFGPLQPVPGGLLSEPTLALDGAGTAYLTGIAQCDNESQSHGVLLTAPPSTRRFGAPRPITPRPATQLRFVVTATGSGLAAWVGAGCSTSELLSGPLSTARVTRTGATATAVLDPQPSFGPSLVAAPGGADVVWVAPTTGAPGGTAQTAYGDASGRFQAPQPLLTGGLIPFAGDSAGDQLLQGAVPATGQPPLAQAAGAQAPQPGPLAAPAGPVLEWVGGSSVLGRALVAVTAASGPLRVATWSA